MLRSVILVFASLAALAQAPRLTNQSIIDMVRARVPAESILAAIAAAHEVQFNLAPNATDAMLHAGVPEDVIKAMAQKLHGTITAAAPVVPPAAVAKTPVANQVPTPPDAATMPYIQRGDKEIGISGTVLIPHGAPSVTTGYVSGSAGYYAARHSLIGVQSFVLANAYVQDFFIAGRYRYLQHTGNPKLFPFVGAAAGVNVARASSLTIDGERFDSDSISNFVGVGEAGIKYFVSRNVSFETAYNLVYMRIEDAEFRLSSASLITFGLAFTF